MVLLRNVGGLDRALRVIVGSILLPCGVWLVARGGGSGWIMAVVVGLLALVTGLTGFCILYVPFGISTGRPTSRAPR